MKRTLLMIVASLPLAACGLGETAVSAAAGAGSQGTQAKEGLRTEARVKQELDAAAALDAANRKAEEANSQ
jgi:hypothetical protein